MNSKIANNVSTMALKSAVFGIIAFGLSFSFPIAALAQVSGDASCCTTGWYDTGTYTTPDTGWYDTGSYTQPSTGYYDTGSYTSPDTGWYDTGSYTSPDTGWYDTGSYTQPSTGWYDTGSYSTPTTGYYDTGTYATPTTGYYDTGSYYPPSYTPTYSYTPCSTCGSSYTPSTPVNISFSAPKSYYTPTTIAVAAPQQQQQQQQQQQSSSGPITIVNTNNNNNVNTNTNTNVAPVTTVAAAPISYPVQYTYPTYNNYNYQYQQPTYQYQAPSCTISLSGNILTWSISGYATSAYITPSVGYVSAQAGTQTRTVYSGYNTTYSMGVSGPGGSQTCQTQIYYQPTYIPQTSVTLSQIPYTGFDFGPVGNAIYWLSLLSFAVAGAYLLVYYRGGAMQLATELIGKRSSNIAEAAQAPMKRMEAALAPIAKKIDRAVAYASFSNQSSKSETQNTTTDTMMIERSEKGSAPRIIISRR